MYDNDEFDSMMEVDDLLFNEEDERIEYERRVKEINEYLDRENKYIKSSGIYTKEEVRQILEEHNRIRREQLAKAKEDFVGEIDWIREQKHFAAENIRMEREYQELERELEIQEIQDSIDDLNARAYRAYREEQAAYDDYLASLDMADKYLSV